MRVLKLTLSLVLFCVVAFAADSPFTGTWKLNIPKSKLLADDTTTSDVYHVTVNDQDISYGEDWSDAKGSRKASYKGKIDGKDYPLNGDPNADTVAYERVGSNELKGTAKKDGKVVSTSKIVVSKDGKITTVDVTIPVEGKSLSAVAIYDKQPN
jgi:hypothetical protein